MIAWDEVTPGAGSGNLAGLDLSSKHAVPQNVLARFTRKNDDGEDEVDTRSLGKAIKRATDGDAVIRSIGGQVFFLYKNGKAPQEVTEEPEGDE